MAITGRNNMLFYYGPLHTLGGFAEIQTALAIIRGFDLVVVNVHTGGDLTLLNKIIEGSKEQNPELRYYMYVELGSVGSGQARILADQWEIDSPSASGLMDGIFLDEFGHDFPSGSRDNQNGIVEYVHDTLGLPVFINPFIPTDVFGQPPNNINNAPALVGADPLFVDTILVESFITLVDGASPIALNDPTRDRGRIDYYIEQRDVVGKNIEIGVMMGVGEGTGLSLNTQLDERTYRDTIDYLQSVNCDWLCVNHGDIGGTSKSFFIQHIQNVFPGVIPSGASRLIKF